MRSLSWIVPRTVLGVLLLAGLEADAQAPVIRVAQSSESVVEGIGGDNGPNPQICARCYEQLKKDNRECESLQGQDWKICTEAAATAYRRCSERC